MRNKLIRLTESDLHRIVENSVRRLIREYRWDIIGILPRLKLVGFLPSSS